MEFINEVSKAAQYNAQQVSVRNEDIKVYGKLVSVSTENVIADAGQIWDDNLKKNQQDINTSTSNKFGEYLPLAGGAMTGPITYDDTTKIDHDEIKTPLVKSDKYILNDGTESQLLAGDGSTATPIADNIINNLE